MSDGETVPSGWKNLVSETIISIPVSPSPSWHIRSSAVDMGVIVPFNVTSGKKQKVDKLTPAPNSRGIESSGRYCRNFDGRNRSHSAVGGSQEVPYTGVRTLSDWWGSLSVLCEGAWTVCGFSNPLLIVRGCPYDCQQSVGLAVKVGIKCSNSSVRKFPDVSEDVAQYQRSLQRQILGWQN